MNIVIYILENYNFQFIATKLMNRMKIGNILDDRSDLVTDFRRNTFPFEFTCSYQDSFEKKNIYIHVITKAVTMISVNLRIS